MAKKFFIIILLAGVLFSININQVMARTRMSNREKNLLLKNAIVYDVKEFDVESGNKKVNKKLYKRVHFNADMTLDLADEGMVNDLFREVASIVEQTIGNEQQRENERIMRDCLILCNDDQKKIDRLPENPDVEVIIHQYRQLATYAPVRVKAVFKTKDGKFSERLKCFNPAAEHKKEKEKKERIAAERRKEARRIAVERQKEVERRRVAQQRKEAERRRVAQQRKEEQQRLAAEKIKKEEEEERARKNAAMVERKEMMQDLKEKLALGAEVVSCIIVIILLLAGIFFFPVNMKRKKK